MNELDLIREVEKYPILYDKSVSGFNKTKLREDAWKEIQETLHVSETECKKRWRSLRDSFIKLLRTRGGRTRWPYHQAMRFLLPHVDPEAAKQLQEEALRREHTDDSDQEDERSHRSLPDISYAVDPNKINQLSEDDDSSSPSSKKARQNSTEDEGCHCNRNDPDELFLLSCAPALKRLNAKQNAVAKLKIQQVLYEAEFGGHSELPYVTPASDCSFDNIENGV